MASRPRRMTKKEGMKVAAASTRSMTEFMTKSDGAASAHEAAPMSFAEPLKPEEPAMNNDGAIKDG